MKAKHISGVPGQKEGAFQDTESHKKFDSPEAAFTNFDILKTRFLSVNEWQNYCGKSTAEFKLFDENGQHVNRKPQEGDYIRIDIPGPGDFEAKGFDWVEITEMDNNTSEKSCRITCKPSKDPTGQSSKIAHFYSAKTSSTFIISIMGHSLKVGVYLRNELPNSQTGFLNRVRNFLISLGGNTRFTKIQWKSFTNGMLDFQPYL